ncbi:hypothetical protein [Candidatus Binatus sp.]|jgi:hypothetical protein|uniref:hypothetical protein n=1 Tax=Candidatus Binatus sp. TaxID=2811406 RepID=UPI003CC6225A
MKPNLLSTIAIGAILALAAARPASADPLFSGATLDDITTCHSSTVYPYDELHACERAMDDLSAQSKATTNQIDLQNVGLEMANVGVIDGYLCRQLGIDGAEEMFSGAHSLLQAILNDAVSAEIAQRAKTMLQIMNGGGI